jgi:hypothetical protein
MDHGLFAMVDVTSPDSRIFEFQADREGLYSHERISETCVLLGFGDGCIMSIDTRMNNRP